MGVDVVVVPGPLPQIAVFARALPGLAEVVRAENRALFSLDDRVHASRPRGRCGNADLPEQTLGKSFVPADLYPRVAAVVGAEETRPGAARDELPRTPDGLPERRVDDARVFGIDRQIGRAGLVAAIEDLLPRPAAVARSEDATLRVRAVRMPMRCDVCCIVDLLVHTQLADVARGPADEVCHILDVSDGAVE